MAFRKKAELLLAHKPDILVIQECEHPDKIKFGKDMPEPTDVLWVGDNTNKGLGVFSFSGFKFKRLRKYNPALKLILPVKVYNDEMEFLLYAVWANNPNDKDGQYVTQVWKALHFYNRYIKKNATILTGDFNSNTIWDKPRRAGNHSTVVKKLERKNIHSVYHKFFLQKQGKEAHPTFYLYKNIDKPYHLDYCFASGDFAERLLSVAVGEHADWAKYSDHMPVIVRFKSREV